MIKEINGIEVNFPDTMSEEEIQSVLDKNSSTLEAVARGLYKGAWQEPRNALGAGMKYLAEGMPYDEAKAFMESKSSKNDLNRLQHPVVSGLSEAAGNVALTAVPVAKVLQGVRTLSEVAPVLKNTLSAIGNAKGVVGVPLAGSIGGAVSALAEGEDPTTGAAVGAIGAPIGAGIGRLAQPVINKAGEAYKQALKLLEANGIKLTPAQLTNSSFLQNVESVLNTLPFSSRVMNDAYDTTRKGYTKSVLKQAGVAAEGVDTLTSDAKSAIEDKFSKAYSNIYDDKVISLNNQDIRDVIALSKSATVGPENKKKYDYALNLVKSFRQGKPGSSYRADRSAIKAYENEAWKAGKDSDAKNFAALRAKLEEGAARNLGPEEFSNLQKLNRERANYGVIQRASSSPDQNTLEGFINPKSLLRQLEKDNPSKNMARYGDLYEIAKAGATVLPDKLANSGTATRLMLQDALMGLGGAAVGGGAGYATGNDPMLAALAGAGAVAAPYAAAKFITSPAGSYYLVNGIPVLREMNKPLARALSGSVLYNARGNE